MIDSLRTMPATIVEVISLWVKIYALLVSVIAGIFSTKRLARFWKTRHLRKVWGIKDGDYVIIVCSEMDEPEKRQKIEPREFIYNLKYGDVDAYFEVVVTLLRLFPKIKLRIMSSGEAIASKMDLERHLILIGGPDYNEITAGILKKNLTQFQYRSPDMQEVSTHYPNEIVLFDSVKKRELCELDYEKDFGYFERVKNPNNPNNKIILLGGCHTIGVTSAVKAFSLADSEHGEIPKMVLLNARKVAKVITSKSEFSVLVSAEQVGQTISVPVVEQKNITVRR